MLLLVISLAWAGALVCETAPAGEGWTEVRCPDLRLRVRAIDANSAGLPPPAVLARAAAEKAAEDERLYGALVRAAGYADLRAWAVAQGYYGSPAHLGWALGAAARAGGLADAAWWMALDPFGGTAGNGPKVLPGGWWPSPLARVAMAHDTDWTLGRYFGVGPMAALRGDAEHALEKLGQVGLVPLSDPRYRGVASYLRGEQPDWVVGRP